MPKPPASGRVDFWDQAFPGFGQRVSAGGHRTWVVMYRYNAIKRRMKLGIYPNMGLADARDQAREVQRRAEKGADPASEQKAVKIRMDTLEDLADLYIEEYAKRKKRSWKKDEQILKREVVPFIGRRRVKDVSRSDVRSVLDPIIKRGAPIRANHTLEVIRKMYNWAIGEKDMPLVNPAARIPKPGGDANSRSRYLRVNELQGFWKALSNELLGMEGAAAFKLLLLTAQREMEVLRMRWEEIDWDDKLWTIPADKAKNELEHVVPLPPFALMQLTALSFLKSAKRNFPHLSEAERKSPNRGMIGYVFQSPVLQDEHVRRVFVEKRIIKVRKASEIPDITIHDLRRTVTTYFGRVRVPQEIKKKILNHAKRKKSDVTDIYDRFEYLAEKRDALVKWEKLLARIVGDDFNTDDYAAVMFKNDDPDLLLETATA